ncbi:HIT family protein [Leuconostocaceae bacterium ESL0958]|nr:HIT family protein [Leuconostocaceae bacterium ESL0958]
MADIFDQIIAGEIPAYKIYEDDDVLAFLDISQVTPGHTLLVPKQHYTNIFDYDEAITNKIMTLIPALAKAIKATDPAITGMNISSNNGESAGQTVPHSHWHLIPRYDDDDLNDTLVPTIDNSANYDQEAYETIATQIRESVEDSHGL